MSPYDSYLKHNTIKINTPHAINFFLEGCEYHFFNIIISKSKYTSE